MILPYQPQPFSQKVLAQQNFTISETNGTNYYACLSVSDGIQLFKFLGYT